MRTVRTCSLQTAGKAALLAMILVHTSGVLHGQVVAERESPVGAVKIFDNFARSPSGRYNLENGWFEDGTNRNGESFVTAMSFTPNTTAVLEQIDVAVTFSSGTNMMTLYVAQDNGGVPGAILSATVFTGIPPIRSCCGVDTVHFMPSASNKIVVTAGQTYWIYPIFPAGTIGQWNFDATFVNGAGAKSIDNGMSWTPSNLSPFGAFDVYGIR